MSEEIKNNTIEKTENKTESADTAVKEEVKTDSSATVSKAPATEKSHENRPQERNYRGPRRDDRGQGQRPRFKRKYCKFCHDKNLTIDYKDAAKLESYITDRGKILPRRVTGTCAKHQRLVSHAIKRARTIALLPFVEK